MNTPKIGHAPIKMRAVKGGYDGIERAGDFYWSIKDGKRELVVAIPTVNGRWVSSCWSIDFKNAFDAQWSWDGNEEAPTLQPSLHAVGIWHGHVQAGELREA